jgi:pimeloyl-ACP methyl ester carboxylesterase
VALPAQIQAHLEFLDELLLAAYDGPAMPRVLLVGHSIGCWFILEMLKARAEALRANSRVGAYLLFPTISHIVRTPNGRNLSVRVSLGLYFSALLLTLAPWGGGAQPFFRPPWPRVLAYLSHLVKHITPIIPRYILALLFQRPSWPANQLQVLLGFLRAPGAVYASLTMAHDEMETVRELDADFLREFAHDLWFYYAEEDGWVGEEQRAAVLRTLRGTAAESQVVLGRAGIPHAFCISAIFIRVAYWVKGLTSHPSPFARYRPQRRSCFAMC